jgi:polyphosphate kinase 2 (PPK2 family)
VEHVMGFCSDEEYEEFMETVPDFEQMLVKSGVRLFKYYLDISRGEQKKRLKARRQDPLKQWKISPIDEKALHRWKDYSRARNAMLARTHHPAAPWTVVEADNKQLARLNLIKDLLTRLDYRGKREAALVTNPAIVFRYDQAYLDNGAIAP